MSKSLSINAKPTHSNKSVKQVDDFVKSAGGVIKAKNKEPEEKLQIFIPASLRLKIKRDCLDRGITVKEGVQKILERCYEE